MKTGYSIRHWCWGVVILLWGCFSLLPAQDKSVAGVKILQEGGQSALQTVPQANSGKREALTAHLKGLKASPVPRRVLDGSIIWNYQDPVAIAYGTMLDGAGDTPLTAWGLNNARVSLYTDANNVPVWEFLTAPNDGVADISGDGSVIAVAAEFNFYLLNPANGNITYQLTIPDSLYASQVAVSRDGSLAIFLASAVGSASTARVYAIDPAGPTPLWQVNLPQSAIGNWAGAAISASGSHVAVSGRFHIYVLDPADGSLIWDDFVDNTESAPAISRDGSVLATADLSGFVQTRVFDPVAQEYNLIWQYRVPAGQFTNWASSVDVSADGGTVLAGSLLFFASGYGGTVMAFDTYGDGLPRWIYPDAGDMVDEIAVSDDGRVAAVVTWGDLNHTLPDLLVFDVASGEVTFSRSTPGSLFSVDISEDGKRVLAGGKAVHARQFGNGGLLYLAEIDLGGGSVSGVVNLSDTGDDSGVLVRALGTERSALTNVSGNYVIENIPAGTYTIRAEKPGYTFGDVAGVVVTNGGANLGVNFTLDPFTAQPPALSASSGLPGAILLSWTGLFPGSPLAGGFHLTPEMRLAADPLPLQKNLAAVETGQRPANPFPANTQLSASANWPLPSAPNWEILNPTRPFGESEIRNPKSTIPAYLADSIAVYRSLLPGGPYQRIAGIPAAQSSYADSGVFPLRDYYYVINLFDETGQSVYSNEALGRVSDSLLTFEFDAPQQSVAPLIDGILSPGEWDDAFTVDISDIFGYFSGTPKPQGSTLMYLKFDDAGDMLYVAGEDFLNAALDNNEGFGLYLDDNNNNDFEPRSALPVYQEGNFWAYWHPTGADLRFRKIYAGGGVGDIITLAGAEVAFSDAAGHVQGEVAIPMGFLEGYQLQVYSPDRVVGLGAFLIARDPQGNPIYNGWWPQTMNSVFTPRYFGSVGIDVSLDAPPKAPSDIVLTRQGNSLLLTWSDPTQGLNNDPLPAPPTIHVYRNGQFLASVNPGVQSLQDDEVICGGWYEYRLEAEITVGGTVWTGPQSNPVGEFACYEPVLVPLAYDDGTWETFYVVDFTYNDNKFAVRYTPPFYPCRVVRLTTIVNGTEAFDFTIHADNSGVPGDLLAGPYRVNAPEVSPVGDVILTLPAIEPPVIESGDFWAVINYLPTSPGAPGIGTDASSPNAGRGWYFTTTSGWMNFTGGNLMVTAYLADPLTGIAEPGADGLPQSFDLQQNYPNPFNPATAISYQLAAASNVEITIYNTLGQKVRTLVNEARKPAGYYRAEWDGRNDAGAAAASGVYLYRLHAGGFIKVRKMLLIR